jgi:Lar family restriction alleviation protein
MTTPERKSCPFCGGSADLCVSNPDGDRRAYVAVYCMSCDAWGPAVDRLETRDGTGLDDDEAAWARWNQRAEAP